MRGSPASERSLRSPRHSHGYGAQAHDECSRRPEAHALHNPPATPGRIGKDRPRLHRQSGTAPPAARFPIPLPIRTRYSPAYDLPRILLPWLHCPQIADSATESVQAIAVEPRVRPRRAQPTCVRSAGEPHHSKNGSEAPRPGRICLPPRLSTFPQPRPSTADTHADQRVHQNYPQACAQGVILAGQRLQATHELEETAGDTTSSRPPGPAGRHRHADRLLAKGGPGQVFTARGQDLNVGPASGGTPTCPV